MGIFTTRIGVANPQSEEYQWEWVEAWVDTGASHSMLPASLLEQVLALTPDEDLLFELGDGREERYGIGQARFQIENRQRTCTVIFGPEGQYLLGANTLQQLNLIADANHHCLVPTPKLRI